jgi:subtilase family serine protease
MNNKRGHCTILSFLLMGTVMCVQAGTSHLYDSTQTINGNGIVHVYDIATDGSGSVVMVGTFSSALINNVPYDGTTDFDPGPGVDNRTPLYPYQNGDAFITKHNADGSYAWTLTFGDASDLVTPINTAIDSAGNIYVTGWFSGSIDFDPGPGTDIHTSGPFTGFMLKLHADGSFAWALTIPFTDETVASGPLGTFYHFKVLKIDANDDVYAMGTITPGTYDFDPAAGEDTQTISGGTAGYVSKYHADGSYAWTRIYPVQDSTDFATIKDLSFDSSGNAIVLANFGGHSSNPTVDVDPSPSTVDVHQQETCYYRGFVTSLDAGGNYGGWVMKTPVGYFGIALDSHDNIYMTGPNEDGYQEPSNGRFACGDYQYYGIDGSHNSATLTKMIGHDSYGWTKRFAVDFNNQPTQPAGVGETVLVDNTDNVYVTSTLFVSRFTPAGTRSWQYVFPGGSYRAAMDDGNNIYMAGSYFLNSFLGDDFDPTAGTDIKTQTGLLSGFVTKLAYDTSNIAPVAADGSFSTDQEVDFSGMLSASDAEGDPLTYAIVDNGTLGTATITDNSTGAFTYSPKLGQTGTDTFTFVVNDGQLDSNVATVTVTIVPAPPGTDLQMTAISGPASSPAGKAVYMSNTVKNRGDIKSGAFKIGLYLSTDSTITTSDTFLGYSYVASLGVNATRDSNTRANIPAGQAPGNYYIGAYADYQNAVAESNENNNAIATPFEVTAPDLVVSAINGPSDPAAPYTYVTLSGTVTNQGKAPSSTTYLRLYFSTDSTITTDDTTLGTLSIGALDPNASKDFSKSVRLPNGLSAGTYYLGAIADFNEKAAETDETNNATATPVTVFMPTPDLVMTALDVPPDPLAPATSITVSATVKNIGTGPSATTYVGFYASPDSTITTDDTYLASTSAGGLDVDATNTVSKTVKLPADLAAGTYYIGAIADYNDRAAELDEGNNSIAAAVTVYIPTPDLTVTEVSVSPTTAAPTNYITLSGTVTNIGSGKTGATTYARFYLSDGTNDIYLKQFGVPGTTDAGASVTKSLNYRLPVGFAPATYTIKLVADDDGTLSESNENNNSLSGNTLTVTP